MLLKIEHSPVKSKLHKFPFLVTFLNLAKHNIPYKSENAEVTL